MAQADWLGSKGAVHLALFLQSPRELLQCSKYDEITINKVYVLLLLLLHPFS